MYEMKGEKRMNEMKKGREEGGCKEWKKEESYLGSTISNKSESVVRSQTSYAFVPLNSDIQSGLKSSIELASPPIYIHPSNQHLHEKKREERTYQTHQ
jgi:hypothetical protein